MHVCAAALGSMPLAFSARSSASLIVPSGSLSTRAPFLDLSWASLAVDSNSTKAPVTIVLKNTHSVVIIGKHRVVPPLILSKQHPAHDVHPAAPPFSFLALRRHHPADALSRCMGRPYPFYRSNFERGQRLTLGLSTEQNSPVAIAPINSQNGAGMSAPTSRGMLGTG
jgi:hypothetical protein